MRVGTPQLQASAQQAELELRQLREENEHLRRELLSGSQGECGPGQGAGSGATSSRPPLSNIPSLEERALLRQLKEVTDRQREELRAHNRDILQRSQETEAVRVGWAGRGDCTGQASLGPRRSAHHPHPLFRPQLQEQLQRLLLVNTELRHKLAAVQTQLRVARDRESERELRCAGAVELAQERAWDQAGVSGCEQRPEAERSTAGVGTPGTSEGPVSAC